MRSSALGSSWKRVVDNGLIVLDRCLVLIDQRLLRVDGLPRGEIPGKERKQAIEIEPGMGRLPGSLAVLPAPPPCGESIKKAAEKDLNELAQLAEALKAAKDDYWTGEVEAQRLGVMAWIAYARGDRGKALQLMRDAADRADKSEKNVVTPGRLIPARELLGDMLLESGQPAAAHAEYETSLLHDPGRFRSLFGAGKAAAQSGDSRKARSFYGHLVSMVGLASTRPELATARQYLASH